MNDKDQIIRILETKIRFLQRRIEELFELALAYQQDNERLEKKYESKELTSEAIDDLN